MALETSGFLDRDTLDFSKLKGIPMSWVLGDNLRKYLFWAGFTARQDRFRENLVKAGGVGDKLMPPDADIKGNSYMMMLVKTPTGERR